ncbi:plasma-membrane proton-efflux P-type ATPase [Streptomyces pluripotens]|uniref:Plasma-membrane proton-efflux P-type ATPase n=1 Tax=Streptomyces pluripotens TaxID=1355015 RepID=A0A221NS80_9ACTN|nr:MULTISPECIES: plasma-membrane proton-efflux P-type ATPase [Streptomyces]ASN22820.1 plasma-membrane proton-efflux P-type ATPase [Streptomyces pluripotens]KIE23350.1 metal ABC transporter ATPase [Streptomyces sp. MUSC 125]
MLGSAAGEEGRDTPYGRGGGGQTVRDQRTEEDRRADARDDAAAGLTSGQAADRLERYGPNVIEEQERSVVLEFLSHFWGPIPWMIEAALALTAATGRWADFAIILALLLLNGLVGFWEEHQAQNAIAALKERLAKVARVERDGVWTEVAASELVPGDLVRIGRGEVVPADGTVVQGDGEADESALTGESLPVAKNPGDDMYSGSAVSRGGPVVRVLATGAETEFGRTAQLTGRAAPVSHFQRAVIDIGKYLSMLALGLVVVIIVLSLLRGSGVARTLEFALVVVIASIPVALPAVLSVTMAVGARYLAKREAVVSHLPAVEEMAGVDVLCADKTGTITRNQLAVADVVVLREGTDQGQVLLQAALTAEPGGGDPIDEAILQASGDRSAEWRVTAFTPFDSARKFALAQVHGPGAEHAVAKGAVQAVLGLAQADAAVAERVEEVTRGFASRGFRAMAVACADDVGWHVTGVLGLQDPPRDDSRATLEEAERLGVQVRMVTGDRVEIAREICSRVGLGTNVLEAGRIERLQGADLAHEVAEADGFAEVVPEDKYRIVQALQEHGHIVGMTGDGVNDAPALHRADAGIAVCGATDAARAASDIVFLAPGLSTIIEAVHRSREVFRRMKNYAIYRITETIRVVLFVTATIVVFAFFPVTPIQVVLLAILNDAAILSIAYDRVRPSSKPERWDLTEVMSIAAVLGLFGLVSTFVLVWVTHLPLALADDEVRTLIYLKLSVSGHLTVFLARTRGPFWSYRPSWILLTAVVGTQVLATAIALTGFLMHPISWNLVGLAWGWALIEFLLLDPVKLLTYRVLERHGRAASVVT